MLSKDTIEAFKEFIKSMELVSEQAIIDCDMNFSHAALFAAKAAEYFVDQSNKNDNGGETGELKSAEVMK